MHRVYLSLGSNIENRINYLSKALNALKNSGAIIHSASSQYETEPWGNKDQEKFLNQCVEIFTEVSPQSLLEIAKNIEKVLGRISTAVRYLPRPIDIDLLFYDNLHINKPDLIIPHPLLHLRRFVLIPMNEIASTFVHPVLNKSMEQLLLECQDNLRVVKI